MSNLSVLVVGANGNLGHRVVDALAARPERPRVVAGVRNLMKDGDLARRWAALGIEQVQVSLDDPASLDAACRGIHTVVCTVQGEATMFIEGQGRLLEACERQGVHRLVPSDFSLDLFALEEGENGNLDARRAFNRRLKASPVGHTFFLNGGFMEAMCSPFIDMIHRAEGTIDLWGDGEDPLDMTTMDDTAAFLAAALVKPDTLGQTIEVVGDRRTGKQIAADYQAATGHPMRFRSRGSIAEGYATIARWKAESADPMRILPHTYTLPMLSQKGRLKNVQNAHFPEVTPTTLRAFFSHAAERS